MILITMGCAGSGLQKRQAPVDEGVYGNDTSNLPDTETEYDDEEPAEQPNKASDASSPAVLALLDEAEADRQQGNLGSAVANIERALRIQPRNASLWHRLAEIRLEQNQPKLAENLARKSNILAGSDLGLIQKNWQLIASAQRLLGNVEAADEAERKASQIEW